MKKVLLYFCLVTSSIVLLSCNTNSSNKNIPTSVELADDLNDNVQITEDNIKLGKSFKQVLNYDGTLNELKVVPSEKASDYPDSYYYCADGDIDRPYRNASLYIEFNGSYSKLLDDEYVVTLISTNRSDCTLYGYKINDDCTELLNLFRKKGYIEKENNYGSHTFMYGNLSVTIKCDRVAKITRFIFSLSTEVDFLFIEEIFYKNNIQLTKDNIINYILPVHFVNKPIVFMSSIVYMDTDEIELKSIKIDCKCNYTLYLGHSESHITTRVYKYLESIFVNMDYCDISYDKRIEDPDTYFSNLDPMDCDIMIARHYRLRNDVAFTYLNFSGVLEKYNYFRELIESDPDYEEYRRTHTFIAR